MCVCLWFVCVMACVLLCVLLCLGGKVKVLFPSFG